MLVWAVMGFTQGFLSATDRSAQAQEAAANQVAAAPNASLRANRDRVRQLEEAFKPQIAAYDHITNELSRVHDEQAAREFRNSGLLFVTRHIQFDERRNSAINRIPRNEMIALKHSIGGRMRSSLSALKQQIDRVESIPGFRGLFKRGPYEIDQYIDFWTIKPGEETPPELTADPTPSDLQQSQPGGPHPGRGPSRGGGLPPGFRFVNPRDNYQRMKDQYGSQVVTIVFRGLPLNSDPTKGVTTFEVSEALIKRIRELAPSVTEVMWLAIGKESALVVAPVDNIAALAGRIDFSRVVVKGDRIEVEVSADYIASVPRLPVPTPGGQGHPGSPGHSREPEFPAGADAVTKSLIQLKSPDINQKKEGLRRLERTPPDERLAEVVAALLPLLEDDDGFLVNDTIKVLGVWKSPEAVPALIKRTSDNRFNVRGEAIKALGKTKDSRAVEPLISRLKEDRHDAVQALKAIGPAAEPALIERLTNPDADIRKGACEVLKEIGGRETLKAMQSLPTDPDFFVRSAANDAMKSIVARVGPLPASERKKAGAGSVPGRGSRR